MEKIKKFIEDNNLDFSGIGSDLNGACIILAGFCLYSNEDNSDCEAEIEFLQDKMKLSVEALDEFERVYNYAYTNNYINFWTTAKAKKMYKF